MTTEALEKIINEFDKEELKKQAIFGLYAYGGGTDESFIRANKEGLELFALELLASAKNSENLLKNDKDKTISLENCEEWIDQDSTIYLNYIEVIEGKRKKIINEEEKSTILDMIMPYGCGFILIVLIVATIIGLINIFNWIF